MYSVYTLADPRTPDDVRYVGITRQSPVIRLRNHTAEGRCRREHCHRVAWLRRVVDSGLVPRLELVADGLSESDAKWFERALIATLRAMACRLVNSTDGGDGGFSTVPEVRARFLDAVRTPEYRERQRRNSTGRRSESRSEKLRARWATASPEALAQVRELGARHKGVKRSEASRAKMSVAARLRSPEFYVALASRLRGRKRSMASRAKQSATNKGKPSAMTAEGRARVAAANHERGQSAESRAKISAARRAAIERSRECGG